MLEQTVVDALRPEIAAHAQLAFPRECCGLIVARANGPLYVPCANQAAEEALQDRFVIAPADWAAAEDQGEVLAVVHSHPNASAHPSMADRVMCEATEVPWLIIGWPSGVVTITEPSGYRAPLIGREFAHGVLDCYTLIQDHYRWELGIELPHFERTDAWWERGDDLYRKGFAQAGFAQVDDAPREHDVLLMMVAARQENHGAVYLGDGTILHHLYGRLSSRDVYGGMWASHTTAVLRHQALA